MDTGTRRALESIRLDWATTRDDIWAPQAPVHVDGLHDSVIDETLRSFGDAQVSGAAGPLGWLSRSGRIGQDAPSRPGPRTRAIRGRLLLAKLLDGESSGVDSRLYHRGLESAVADAFLPAGPVARQTGQRRRNVPDDLRAIVGDAPLSGHS